MIEPKRIFIDTSGWVELSLKGELHHQTVADYFLKEQKDGSKFFTCDYVLDETFTRLLTGQSFAAAKKFKLQIEKAEETRHLLILWTETTLFKKAWGYFTKFSEHKLSFTDSLIVALVKDFKINIILSLDQGFKKVGLNVRPRL
ncbi:MAG: PIN domain-containing protein [Patescibacteria group bacterium]|nr:PIN domain-containing protein [Patescibacteria group bacterium]